MTITMRITKEVLHKNYLRTAYKTVSLHSALVIAGILPLDLRIHKAAALYEARRGLPQPSLGDIKLENNISYKLTPHPAINISCEFMCPANQENINAQNNIEIRFYTDGSKIEDMVGAPLSLCSDEAAIYTRKFKLSPHCTITRRNC